MKLTLHYKNEAHKKDFMTTESFHGNERHLREIVKNCDKTVVKAYVNGKTIDILKFKEDVK